MKMNLNFTTKFLFFFYLAIAFGCAGKPFYHNSTLIKENVQKISFQTDADDKTIFEKLKSAAVKDGYSIVAQDASTYSFQTDFKSAAKDGGDIATDVQLKVSIQKTKVVVTGNAKQGIVIPGAINLGVVPIRLTGQEGSLLRVAWNELYRFSSQMSNRLFFE